MTKSYGVVRFVVLCWISALLMSCAKSDVTEANARSTLDQAATYRLLNEYLATGDPLKRIQIRDAKGLSEIVASRMFRALDILALGAKPHDRDDIVKEARKELRRNPKLSLTVLRGVVTERENFPDYRSSYSFGPDAYIDLYMNLCAETAQIEADDFAYGILNELTHSQNNDISKNAKLCVALVRRENVEVIGEAYRETQQWKDLMWLVTHYLREGLLQAEIISHFGKGKTVDVSTTSYDALDGPPNVTQLYLHYFDGKLEKWEWM